MKLTCALVFMLLFITGTTIFLFAIHAKAATTEDVCFDELLLRWNQFASDSNQHMHTVEAKPEKRQKTHEKLDREYAAVKALACW